MKRWSAGLAIVAFFSAFFLARSVKNLPTRNVAADYGPWRCFFDESKKEVYHIFAQYNHEQIIERAYPGDFFAITFDALNYENNELVSFSGGFLRNDPLLSNNYSHKDFVDYIVGVAANQQASERLGARFEIEVVGNKVTRFRYERLTPEIKTFDGPWKTLQEVPIAAVEIESLLKIALSLKDKCFHADPNPTQTPAPRRGHGHAG